MNSKTASIFLNSSKDDVFSYLSNVQNLPNWATEFCKELKVVDGKHKVVSPMGELFFKIIADEKTGMIDMFYGPAEDKMSVLTTQVLTKSKNSSEFSCTCHQDPALSNEEFDRQFESLKRELKNLEKQFN